MRPRQRARAGKSRVKFYRPDALFGGLAEFVHVHLCLRRGAETSGTENTSRVAACGCAPALVGPCAQCAP